MSPAGTVAGLGAEGERSSYADMLLALARVTEELVGVAGNGACELLEQGLAERQCIMDAIDALPPADLTPAEAQSALALLGDLWSRQERLEQEILFACQEARDGLRDLDEGRTALAGYRRAHQRTGARFLDEQL